MNGWFYWGFVIFPEHTVRQRVCEWRLLMDKMELKMHLPPISFQFLLFFLRPCSISLLIFRFAFHLYVYVVVVLAFFPAYLHLSFSQTVLFHFRNRPYENSGHYFIATPSRAQYSTMHNLISVIFISWQYIKSEIIPFVFVAVIVVRFEQ